MDKEKLKIDLSYFELINELEQIELKGGIAPIETQSGFFCNNDNCSKDKCEKEE